MREGITRISIGLGRIATLSMDTLSDPREL